MDEINERVDKIWRTYWAEHYCAVEREKYLSSKTGVDERILRDNLICSYIDDAMEVAYMIGYEDAKKGIKL